MESRFKETFLFPVDSRSMINGEKNKVIKIFLNQMDLKFNKLVEKFPEDMESLNDIKNELRQIFLDNINGFSRLTQGLLKNYITNAYEFERLLHVIDESTSQKNIKS